MPYLSLQNTLCFAAVLALGTAWRCNRHLLRHHRDPNNRCLAHTSFNVA
jgi:hypothetical protein